MAGDSAVRIQVLELDRRSVYGSSDGARLRWSWACAHPSGLRTVGLEHPGARIGVKPPQAFCRAAPHVSSAPAHRRRSDWRTQDQEWL